MQVQIQVWSKIPAGYLCTSLDEPINNGVMAINGLNKSLYKFSEYSCIILAIDKNGESCLRGEWLVIIFVEGSNFGMGGADDGIRIGHVLTVEEAALIFAKASMLLHIDYV